MKLPKVVITRNCCVRSTIMISKDGTPLYLKAACVIASPSSLSVVQERLKLQY